MTNLQNITIIHDDYSKVQEDTSEFYSLLRVEQVNVEGALADYRLYDEQGNLVAELSKIEVETVELEGDELARWYANTDYTPEENESETFNFLKV